MIQPVSPAPFPALALPAESLPQTAGDTAQGADFSAFLAIEALPLKVERSPEGALPAALPQAAIAATPGNILPSALPQLPDGTEQLAQPAAPAIVAPVLSQPVVPPATAPAAVIMSSETVLDDTGTEPVPAGSAPQFAAIRPAQPTLPVKPVRAGAPEPKSKPDAEADLDIPANSTAITAEPLALDPVLAEPPLPVPVIPAATDGPKDKPLHQDKPDPKPEHENSGKGAAHRTLPSLPATASAAAQAQLQRRTAAVPPTETELAAPAAIPAPVPVAAMVPTEEVRAELLLPRLTAPGALIRDEARPLAKAMELTLPDTASSLGPALPPPQTHVAAQAVPIPQIRPHDFAALIERIAVAREAAAPQAVSITLTHQDFGPVRLNFRPEDSGLSVAMSSADPGFARAAAAAPAPVLPVTASDSAQFSQQQRGESSAAQTGGQSQSRGGSAEHRRDGQPQPQANSAPRSSQPGAAQRSGIFA